MSKWSLQVLLESLHQDIEQRLGHARKALIHPGIKGDASEQIWRELLETYLPERYRVATAHVVDSDGSFSEQIDVVVYDRHYSPLIFVIEGQKFIPAESIYAVFEAKQTLNSDLVACAQKKIASARVLKRTSMPVPNIAGMAAPKKPQHIWGGILTFESDWKPALGDPFVAAMKTEDPARILDIGCCAAHGSFWINEAGQFEITPAGKPATAFLLELSAKLQSSATVPMIDVRAYAAWLAK